MAARSGTIGDDVLSGTDGPDYLQGLDGDDVLQGCGGDDLIRGGRGDDLLEGDDGTDTVSCIDLGAGVALNLNAQGRAQDTGAGGIDTITGFENATGTRFDDVLTGSFGAINVLKGCTGDDLLLAAGDAGDLLLGGQGNDTADLGLVRLETEVVQPPGSIFPEITYFGLTIDLATSTTLRSIENLIGTIGGDTFYGTDGANRIDAGEAVSGIADTVYGRGGDDRLSSNGPAALDGGAGEDELVLESDPLAPIARVSTLRGGAGDDRIVGGVLSDTALFDGSFSAAVVTIDGEGFLIRGPDGVDHVEDVEHFEFADRSLDRYELTALATGALIQQGGTSADRLEGGALADYLSGEAGDDTLLGQSNDDFLFGEAGEDSLQGGAGDDVLFGETDPLLSTLDVGDDALDGGAGDDRLEGGAGDDALRGGTDNDRLLGQAGADLLCGGDGDDVMDGGFGPTTIIDDDPIRGFEVDFTIDIASYADATQGVTVDLARIDGQDTFGAGIDTLSGIEALRGSAHDDVLYAKPQFGPAVATAWIEGGAGDDVLYAGVGGQLLSGGQGDDRFIWRSFTDGVANLRPDAAQFAPFDVVDDFDADQDQVDFRPLGLAAGDVLASVLGSTVELRLAPGVDPNGENPDFPFLVQLRITDGTFSLEDDVLV